MPRPYLPEPRATAGLLAVQLGQLGFKVEIKQARDRSEYQDWNRRGAYDMVLGGWIPDTPDPLDFMESLLGATSIPSPANQTTRGSNFCRWRGAEMDQALEKQRLKPESALPWPVRQVILVLAGHDPLRDEHERLAEAIISRGGACTVLRFPEAAHGFFRLGSATAAWPAARAIARAW